MADSLIDVGLGNGGEEIACFKVAERAWQENFPDKGEEKRAGAKSPGTKSLTFSPADRSYPPAPPRSSRSSFSPLPFHLAEYFRPRRISEKFNSEYSKEERKIYENVEEKKRRKRIVIVARIESEIIFESSSSKETERADLVFLFLRFRISGRGGGGQRCTRVIEEDERGRGRSVRAGGMVGGRRTNEKLRACGKHRACNSLFKEHLDDN